MTPNSVLARKHLPPKPEGFDPETFFKAIQWYQKWEMFAGVFTPGINPIEEICDLIHLPQDLSGRRVLDLGSNNGCMSLECERRGAAEVIGVTPCDTPAWGHHQLKAAVDSSRTRFIAGSVYDLNPDTLGHFDVVLFCGVLYHLRYPTLAIDNIRRVATGDVFIETHISDYELGRAENKLPLWRFYRHDDLNHDHSNWFGPNVRAVLEGFSSAGFQIDFLSKNENRARFKACVKEGLPEFLTIPCAEAESYSAILEPLFGERESWDRN